MTVRSYSPPSRSLPRRSRFSAACSERGVRPATYSVKMTRVTAGTGAESRLRGKNGLPGIALRLGHWKDDRERRSHADFALHGQVAAHSAGQVATDREAESRAVAGANE